MAVVQFSVKGFVIFLFQLNQIGFLYRLCNLSRNNAVRNRDNVFDFLTALFFLLFVFIQVIQYKNINPGYVRKVVKLFHMLWLKIDMDAVGNARQKQPMVFLMFIIMNPEILWQFCLCGFFKPRVIRSFHADIHIIVPRHIAAVAHGSKHRSPVRKIRDVMLSANCFNHIQHL